MSCFPIGTQVNAVPAALSVSSAASAELASASITLQLLAAVHACLCQVIKPRAACRPCMMRQTDSPQTESACRYLYWIYDCIYGSGGCGEPALTLHTHTHTHFPKLTMLITARTSGFIVSICFCTCLLTWLVLADFLAI